MFSLQESSYFLKFRIGVGVTVKTSCSPNWKNGKITFNLLGSDGSHPLKNEIISVDGKSDWHNLLHKSPAYYLASFDGIPEGYTIHVQVWIYG